MGSVRVVQISDLRWGHVACLDESLSFEWFLDRVRTDQRRVVSRLEELCREVRPHLVLVAGNLIDDAWCSPDLVGELVEAFSRLAPARIFIASGDADPPHAAGYLKPTTLPQMGREPWPDNVTVFESCRPHAIPAGEVSVVGWVTRPAHGPESPTLGTDGTAWSAVLAAAGPGSVVVAHRPPAGAGPVDADLTDRLAARGVVYFALGHVPAPTLFSTTRGAIRGACAGPCVAHSLPGGSGRIAVARIADDGAVAVEFVPSGARQTHLLRLDTTGLRDNEALSAHVASLLEQNAVGEDDLVRLQLSGRWAGSEPPAAPASGCGRFRGPLLLDADGVVLARRGGRTVRDLHLAGLWARTDGPRSIALAASLAAWSGKEVKPPR